MRHLYGAIMFFVSMLAGLALPAQAEPGHGAFSVGYAQVHPGGVPALSGTGARTGDLKGINVKYRYEFTDHLGGIVSLSYASSKKSRTTMTGDKAFHYESLRGRYVSVMAGPVLQVSDRVSAYAMTGMAYSRWSDSIQDYRRTNVAPGYVKETTTASDGHAARHLSMAWSAGVQFFPADSVVIDLAYEGSGSGDWRTDGFIAGVGYKF
ncbi:Ail/Lom family outer membrane beta-barrel protein [Escherichia coli]|uniref:Ail/Lom family outer membrane beta-barrel protein n=1 Tax=Escherichia coli TaxID=562 RepID=UPI0016504E5A|nr:Ail/Lom family outer membrane beta-barrel protein [Escherichia coli]MBC6572512.1 Ail/Lom family outer membrane beta-barrel protein [Escherichia coli]